MQRPTQSRVLLVCINQLPSTYTQTGCQGPLHPPSSTREAMYMQTQENHQGRADVEEKDKVIRKDMMKSEHIRHCFNKMKPGNKLDKLQACTESEFCVAQCSLQHDT